MKYPLMTVCLVPQPLWPVAEVEVELELAANNAAPTPPKLLTNIASAQCIDPIHRSDIGYVEAGQVLFLPTGTTSRDVVDTKSNKLIAQFPGPFTGAGATTRRVRARWNRRDQPARTRSMSATSTRSR